MLSFYLMPTGKGPNAVRVPLTPAREGGEGGIGAVVSELQADHSTFLTGIELQPTGPEASC